MKNGTRIFLICLIIILLLGYVVGFAYCTFNKYASADEITDNSLLGFNQLFNNTLSRGNYNTITITKKVATYSVNGYFTGYSLNLAFNETSPSINIYGGHKYYIDYQLKVNAGSTPNLRIFNTSGGLLTNGNNGTQFFTPSSDQVVSVGFQVIPAQNSSSNPYNFSCTPILIDITQMFGEEEAENITIQYMKSLLTADYYIYTLNSPITLNGFDSYNKALNDVFSNYKYRLDRNALSTQTQATNLQETLTGTIRFAYNDDNWYVLGAMYCPLFTVINANSEFNIEIQLYAPSGRDERFLCFGTYVNGELNEIYRIGHNGSGDTLNISFTTPIDISTLYVYQRNGTTLDIEEMNYMVGIFNIKVEQLDIASALMSSYSSGYNTCLEYYSRGGLGFQEIFDQGKATGLIEANGTFTAMDYVKTAFITLGEILMIEVFPNFTLGAFFLLPLLTSTIFFIIKLTRGGS